MAARNILEMYPAIRESREAFFSVVEVLMAKVERLEGKVAILEATPKKTSKKR